MNVGPFIKKLNSNFFWVVLNQVASRLLVAMKFFILARVLGPQSMGILSTLLLILAMVETFTELGVLQSIVYQKNKILRGQMHVIWTFNLLRGVVIGMIIIVAAPLLKMIFSFSESIFLIILMAFIPVIRGLSSYNLLLAERNGLFKKISILQVIYILTDFIFSVIVSTVTKNITFVVYSMIFSEGLKTILSYVFFKGFPKFSFKFSLIKENLSYGKWITANSITIFLLNQLDKILTSRYLGAYQLGIYQMASKLSQFALADLFSAICRYCFPLFSTYNRKDLKLLNKLFLDILYLVIFGLTILTTVIFLNAEIITEVLLGKEWMGSVKIFQVLLFSSFIGSINMFLVTYLRSVGKPNIVTLATTIQLSVFLPASFLAMTHKNLYVLSVVVVFSVLIAFLVLILYISKLVKDVFKNLFLSLLHSIPIVIILYIASKVISNISLLCLSCIVLMILMVVKIGKVKQVVNFINGTKSNKNEKVLDRTQVN
ncbi:hypothetical protein CN383_16225 [Priestia megaterium]|uniref:oligosaccharide flippase family protein n=1 Tax=Priestia megaterium TaxID=1404 RepID=UPI000BF3F801|nr:oligosaccharide flippase family protein [Priestia megaterium]PFA99197.1 hypothetical protein CN383_16225 [Priestia megaterium]